MDSPFESNTDPVDICNPEEIGKEEIGKEEIGKEANEIKYILHKLSDITIDDEFTINNDGNKYKLGNDSKIISKIYELIITEKLKYLLDSMGFKYIENDIQNKYPDFIIISNIQKEKYYAIDIKSTYLTPLNN